MDSVAYLKPKMTGEMSGGFKLQCVELSVLMSLIHLYSAASQWLLYCAVCVIHRKQLRFQKLSLMSAGSRRLSGREFRVAEPATEKANDDQGYSASNAVQSDSADSLIVNGVDRQCPRLDYSSSSGKPEPYSVSNGTLWRPAWIGCALERQASISHCAAELRGLDHTSGCKKRVASLRWERAVTCRWSGESAIAVIHTRREWRRHGRASWWRLCLGIVWLLWISTFFSKFYEDVDAWCKTEA